MKKSSSIIKIEPLSQPWKTQDPFIFCAHHTDQYPGGNNVLGPKTGVAGRNIGQDFSGKDGWSMYHGINAPGFPAHPHCGFETVTIVPRGMIDHSDSLGAHGRFGDGDVQWLTAGKGVQHAEMFPLLKEDNNPLELFQLWFNLPAKSKLAAPYYNMLWKEDIPVVRIKDEKGNATEVDLISGRLGDYVALSPNPDSWAADENNHVQIWKFKMDAHASFSIPPIKENVTRSLYFYEGDTVSIENETIGKNHLIELNSEKEVSLINGSEQGFFVFLQGRPIEEPVVQYGPFLAESEQTLNQRIQEYRKTQFGGWPWPSSEPVHGKAKGRFSITPDGNKVFKSVGL